MNFDSEHEFKEYVENLKNNYLGVPTHRTRKELDEDFQKSAKRRRKLIVNMKGRRKFKKEICRLEAKLIKIELEGRLEERAELAKKIKNKKAAYLDKIKEYLEDE